MCALANLLKCRKLGPMLGNKDTETGGSFYPELN